MKKPLLTILILSLIITPPVLGAKILCDVDVPPRRGGGVITMEADCVEVTEEWDFVMKEIFSRVDIMHILFERILYFAVPIEEGFQLILKFRDKVYKWRN